MPRDIETFVDNSGHIFLLSHDQASLKDVGKAIVEYVKNTYPSTSYCEIVIRSFDSEPMRLLNQDAFPDELARLEDYLALNEKEIDQNLARFYAKENILHQCQVYYKKANHILDQGYTYALNLDLLLPNAVKTLFNLSHRYQRSHVVNRLNCHGGALIAAGMFPMANYYEYPIMEQDIANGIHSTSFDELLPGDIITLAHYDHSMVYLADDICISVNDRCQPMGIYTIQEVVAMYLPNLPYSSLKDLVGIASFFRKDTSLQYSEAIINMVKESYLLELSLCHAHSIGTVMEDKLNALAKSLMLECLSTHVLQRWKNKFTLTTYDANLREVLNNIRLVQKTYNFSNARAIAMLEKPSIWQNITILLTKQGKQAFTDGRITLDDVLACENVEDFAKKMQPPTCFRTLMPTFFALPHNIKKSTLNNQLYIIGMFCAATTGLWMAYQLCSTNNNEAQNSNRLNP